MAETVEVARVERKPSETSLQIYRVFITLMTSAATGLAGVAVAFLATMHNDIIDLRINGATMIGQYNLMNRRLDDINSEVTKHGNQLGILSGRVIVLEQNVKVK